MQTDEALNSSRKGTGNMQLRGKPNSSIAGLVRIHECDPPAKKKSTEAPGLPPETDPKYGRSLELEVAQLQIDLVELELLHVHLQLEDVLAVAAVRNRVSGRTWNAHVSIQYVICGARRGECVWGMTNGRSCTRSKVHILHRIPPEARGAAREGGGGGGGW